MTASAIAVTGWTALLLAALALEIAARRGRGPATARQSLDAVLATVPGRLLAVGVWLWLGVHFLAR